MQTDARRFEYLADNFDYVLTTEGEAIDLRPYRKPKRSNRYPLKGVEFDKPGTPVTARPPRKETMTDRYTDEELKQALTEATRERQYIEIDTSVGDADFGTEEYWNLKSLDEIGDLRAIVNALDKIDENKPGYVTWHPAKSIREVKRGERYRITFGDYAYEGLMTGQIIRGETPAAYIAGKRWQYAELHEMNMTGLQLQRIPHPYPDPKEHEFIIDRDGKVWRRNANRDLYHRYGMSIKPANFGALWKPAKVVPDNA